MKAQPQTPNGCNAVADLTADPLLSTIQVRLLCNT